MLNIEVNEKSLWKVSYLTELKYRTIDTNAGRQRNIILQIFFINIELSFLMPRDIGIELTIFNIYWGSRIGWLDKHE
tara:strand:- start:709 stop:939 length:231 start_codon:yes stop_codon:yes gene_type:complete